MHGFFKTLIRPDREETPERAEIANAANLIQVGVFQLLQLAYRDWHGHELAPKAADRLFGAYMLDGLVPHWARHYARHIFALDAAGMLDDTDPRYHRYDSDYRTHTPDGVRQFCIAALAITVFVGGGLWMSHLATGGNTSFLPPYFDEKELTPRR